MYSGILEGQADYTVSSLFYLVFFFNFCQLLEIKIHQVTCPPQHGKGECDGHGAVIKRKARLFLLLGMCSLFFSSSPLLSLFLAENHIDNPTELSDFIEKYNKDATGKHLSMQQHELENATDASPIPNIKSNFEYVWNPNDKKGLF